MECKRTFTGSQPFNKAEESLGTVAKGHFGPIHTLAFSHDADATLNLWPALKTRLATCTPTSKYKGCTSLLAFLSQHDYFPLTPPPSEAMKQPPSEAAKQRQEAKFLLENQSFVGNGK